MSRTNHQSVTYVPVLSVTYVPGLGVTYVPGLYKKPYRISVGTLEEYKISVNLFASHSI